jgi:hypothetical protein
MDDPEDLDDFHSLASLINILPKGTFRKSELESIRDAYDHYADRYPSECGLTDPDELRGDASLIETIGGMLGVDTRGAQESLENTASEIEEEQEHGESDNSDDDYRGGGSSEECSDSDLDSMFGTL